MWLNPVVIFEFSSYLTYCWHLILITHFSLLPGPHALGLPPVTLMFLLRVLRCFCLLSQSTVLGPPLTYFYTNSLCDATQCQDFKMACRCISLPSSLSREMQTPPIQLCGHLHLHMDINISASHDQNQPDILPLQSRPIVSPLHLLMANPCLLFRLKCNPWLLFPSHVTFKKSFWPYLQSMANSNHFPCHHSDLGLHHLPKELLQWVISLCLPASTCALP